MKSIKRNLFFLLLYLCIGFSCFVFAEDWEVELQQKILKNNPPQWMLDQIQEDLSPFSNGISKKNLKQIAKWENGNFCKNLLLIRVKIKNNEVKIKSEIPKSVIVQLNEFEQYLPEEFIQTRLRATVNAFETLAKKFPLPDVDFFVSLYDHALKNDIYNFFQIPIFVYAKDINNDTNCILIPDFDALRGYDNLLKITKIGAITFPWENKINKAFWRGAMTGGNYTVDNFLSHQRSKLVNLSLNDPELVDARFCYVCQTHEPEAIQERFSNYLGQYRSIEDHLRYKYQILIDGNSCGYSRAYWGLFSNCVLFKQSSPNIQWYYRTLKEYFHYIPVNNDMSDLIEKIHWAQKNDALARQISINANNFAINNLKYSDILHYLYLLLNEYAKLQH